LTSSSYGVFSPISSRGFYISQKLPFRPQLIKGEIVEERKARPCFLRKDNGVFVILGTKMGSVSIFSWIANLFFANLLNSQKTIIIGIYYG